MDTLDVSYLVKATFIGPLFGERSLNLKRCRAAFAMYRETAAGLLLAIEPPLFARGGAVNAMADRLNLRVKLIVKHIR